MRVLLGNTTRGALIGFLFLTLGAGACSDEAEGTGSSAPGDDGDVATSGADVPQSEDLGLEVAPEDAQESGDAPSPDDTVAPDDATGDTNVDQDTALVDAPSGEDVVQDASDVEDAEGESADATPGFTVDVKPMDTAMPLEDTSSPSDVSVPTDPDTGPGSSGWDPATPWLLTVDNTTKMLQKVNVETAETIDVCNLDDGTPPGGLLAMPTYPSLTFSRFNGLYASRQGGSLDQIDPCTCEITPIGAYGDYSGIYGITSDEGDNLYGVATVQDWLVAISTEDGHGHGVGALGYDFTTAGATWSDASETLFAINGGTDGLYTIEPTTGIATLLSTLDYDFGTVGIELHPDNGVIYACSSDAHLLSVGLDGKVTDIGDMGQAGSCTNLAAPWMAVPCLDDI